MLEDIDALYRRYAPFVRRRALSIVGNDSDADDVVHEVFVRAMRSADTFRGASSPMTWLYRVTTNVCLDKRRTESRRGELYAERVAPAVAKATTPEASAARIALEPLMRELDDDCCKVAIHFFVDEMSQNEIAAQLGVSRRTVGYRLQEFRKQAKVLAERTNAEAARL